MTHKDLIDLWPTLSDFAADIGVEYGTAKAMRRRGSIPSEYWLTAVNRARERKLKGVSLAVLAEAVAKDAVAAPGQCRTAEIAS